jgi:hypothetical protein
MTRIDVRKVEEADRQQVMELAREVHYKSALLKFHSQKKNSTAFLTIQSMSQSTIWVRKCSSAKQFWALATAC